MRSSSRCGNKRGTVAERIGKLPQCSPTVVCVLSLQSPGLEACFAWERTLHQVRRGDRKQQRNTAPSFGVIFAP